MSNRIKYEYHHIGIPTDKPQTGERYSSPFKMYTTDGHNDFRIQWHRFEEGCPLHPLVQTVPHVAFKVDSIDQAIEGKVVLIVVEGAPVEFIETTLSEEQIWSDSHENSVIYPNK
jgi:hypothetical protein